MNRIFGRTSSSLPVVLLAWLLAVAVAGPAEAQAPAPPAPPGNSSSSSPLDRDAELSRRLDSLLAETGPGLTWSIAVEAVGEKDARIHRIYLWDDGVGIWGDESQFVLDAAARKEVLKAFRDHGFCQFNDELQKKGSGERKSPSALVQEQLVTLEIGGVSKSVSHVVSSFGRYPDVEEAAKTLVKLVKAVRKICEGPAARGVRAKDLADGLSKIAGQRLADVAFKVVLSLPQEAGGGGSITRIDGRRVRAEVSAKGKGWAPPAEIRLPVDEFVEFVRTVAAAKPGAFPQNIHDEGYTDLTVSVLNHTVITQARPFAKGDPKAHEELRKDLRTIVAAVRKLQEKALLEGRKP